MPADSTTGVTAGLSFMNLPTEIRLEIYSHVFTEPRCAKLVVLSKIFDETAMRTGPESYGNQRNARNILLVNKTINYEATELLYNSTQFVIHVRADDEDYLRLVSIISSKPIRPLGAVHKCTLLTRMRQLSLEIQPLTYLYQCQTAFDTDAYLQRLRSLLQAMECGKQLKWLRISFTFPEAIDTASAKQVYKILEAFQDLQLDEGTAVDVSFNKFAGSWFEKAAFDSLALRLKRCARLQS